jgi:hypothetical protein
MSLETGVNLQDITELRKFGNKILTFTDVESVVEETYREVVRKLKPQTFSLFLFSKEGCIERYKIYGEDKYGIPIEDTWFLKESYEPGESFSGKAAYGKPYGEPYWSNSLDGEVDKLSHGGDYAKKLGFLRCGISVPLNGTRRTFGTIEVINRINPKTRKADPELVFDESHVCWLTIAGAHVAAAISRLRRKDEEKIFTTISRVLADPQLEEHPIHSVYQWIAEKLVDHLMPYKACIVRLTFDGKSLVVTDKAHSDGDKGWKYRIDEDRFPGQGVVGKVFESGKYEKIEYIEEGKSELTNLKWIQTQNLKSFICFPLLILGKVIGTLSLFTGYAHEFSDSDIEFLENVSFLLAAFRVRSEKVKAIEIFTDTSGSSVKVSNEDTVLRDFVGDYDTYLNKTLITSFEEVLKLYQDYLERREYGKAADAANSAYEMCNKILESLQRQDNEELYRKLVALASYWKLNKDLYSVRSRIDGDIGSDFTGWKYNSEHSRD